jgi:transposase
LALDQQIWALHRQGWPGHAIATPLGLGKHTVFRALRPTTFPERKPRSDRGRRLLTPSTPARRARWHAGGRDALRLFRARQQLGYAGSDVTVARYAPRLRQAPGQTPRQRRPRHPLPLVTAPPHRALTPRRATWLVLRRPEQRTPEAEHRLAQRTAQEATRAAAIARAQDFAQRVRPRQPALLAPWLARAAESPLLPLQRFAKGRRDDDDAVNAGVPLPWSTGPVEGHMNRVKRLKRQMCGRASLDLLQCRVLLAAYGWRQHSYQVWRPHHPHDGGRLRALLNTWPPP